MSVNLQKGQKVDLTKNNPGIKRIIVALGWDEFESPKSGFFSTFSGNKKQTIDCDASAILCNKEGKFVDNSDIVYFGNLKHLSNSVNHMGDNLTGAGDGDDEQIIVDLANLPSKFEKIVFVVNIYKAKEKKQHFGLIKNAFIRIVDVDTQKELCKYNLSENYENMTALIFGEVYKINNEWKFGAIGQPTTDDSISEIVKRFK